MGPLTDEKSSSNAHEDEALVRTLPECLATAALLGAIHAYHQPHGDTSVLTLSRQAMAAVRSLIVPQAHATAGPGTPPRPAATTTAKPKPAMSVAPTKTPRRAATKVAPRAAPTVRVKARPTTTSTTRVAASRSAPARQSVGEPLAKKADGAPLLAFDDAAGLSSILGRF